MIPKCASVCVASVIHGGGWGVEVVLLILWFLCGPRELSLVVMTVGDTAALLTR